MKLDENKFDCLFGHQFGHKRKNLIQSPAFGVDTSIISIDNQQDMIVASDPLSYIPSLGAELSAYLSIYLIVNDIATSGKAPQFFQTVMNLSENMSESEFKAYWHHIHLICKDLKISISGGHTGWVIAQNSTVSGGGTMFSIGEKGSFMTSNQAQEGDVILMTKQAATVSTAILGLQFPETMNQLFGKNLRDEFIALFQQISVLKEGLLASEFNQKRKSIHAMHDVTEGGVLNAVFEFAQASGLSCEIDLNQVKVLENQWIICEKFQISPFEIIGAGAMLIAIQPNDVNEFIHFLKQNHIEAQAIGNFKPKESTSYYKDLNQKIKPLKNIPEDPYWAAFFQGLKNNWK